MEFNYRYQQSSRISGSGDRTQMSFCPRSHPQAHFFSGRTAPKHCFSEAISALHDVVVSDLRFKPKDKTAYKEWAAQRNEIDWQLIASQKQAVTDRLQSLDSELTSLYRQRSARFAEYNQAVNKYFE